MLAPHGRPAPGAGTLADSADLYQAGLGAHASVNVMLGLESAFDVGFPHQLFTRNVFSGAAAIPGALSQLVPA